MRVIRKTIDCAIIWKSTLVAMAEERLFSLPNRREEGTKVVIVPVLIFPGNRTSSVSSVSTATRGGTYTRPEYRALCILCVADRVPGSGSPYRFNHDRMSRTLEGIWTTIGCWSHQTRGQRQKSHSAREGRWVPSDAFHQCFHSPS